MLLNLFGAGDTSFQPVILVGMSKSILFFVRGICPTLRGLSLADLGARSVPKRSAWHRITARGVAGTHAIRPLVSAQNTNPERQRPSGSASHVLSTPQFQLSEISEKLQKCFTILNSLTSAVLHFAMRCR